MGWGSAVGIFDDIMDTVMETVHNPMDQDVIAYKVACVLWDGDWDTEQDSNHYDRFSHILSAQDKHDQRHPWVDPEAGKHPEPRTYRKKFEPEALQWTGHNLSNLADFIKDRCQGNTWGLMALNESGNGHQFGDAPEPESRAPFYGGIAVYDRLHKAWIPFYVGDHIMIGPVGESYPVNAAVMAKTYEEV